jgi:OOP family OmpA-OmpF porin
MRKTRVISALAMLGLLSSGTAFAQSDNRAPWRGDFWGYMGISAGESKFRTECSSLFDCDRKDTGWKVYAGGRMNEIIGIEVGYTDFGRIRALGGETDAWAVPITVTAGIPIGERFSVFGKAGGLYGRTDVDAGPGTLFDTGHKSGWGWTYGVGAGFNITPTLQLRADWDRYKLDFIGGRRDVDMATAGLALRF